MQNTYENFLTETDQLIRNCLGNRRANMESLIQKLPPFSGLLYNETTIAVLLTTLSIICIYYYLTNKGLPPGPVAFPFFGYSLILKDNTSHLTMEKLQKKYGDLFCFNFAGNLYINMGSMKAIKELHLTKADCFQRTEDFSVLTMFFDGGVSLANGEPWKVLRKFTLQQLREFGMTTVKDNMSEPLYDSIKETIGYLKSREGEPLEIVQYLTNRCNATLVRTMFGECGITEQQVKDINASYVHVISLMPITNLLYSGKFSRLLWLFRPAYWNAMKHYKIMTRILGNVIEAHKAKVKDEDHPRNFIDAYLKERNDRCLKGDPTADYFSDKALVSSLLQFLSDGVLSVAIFISLFMKHAIDHPEFQDKIYSEIVEVVGRDRVPTIEDKSNLLYTNAYLIEVMRKSDFFTLFPSQQCIKETFVRGYRIPKGAFTLMNLWTCHHDPDVYTEPEKFDPTRFLHKDKSQRPELPITFGLGRRTCIGEGFTMAQVFLFLTAVIQNFKLSAPKESVTGTYELMMSGKMQICATPRNE